MHWLAGRRRIGGRRVTARQRAQTAARRLRRVQRAGRCRAGGRRRRSGRGQIQLVVLVVAHLAVAEAMRAGGCYRRRCRLLGVGCIGGTAVWRLVVGGGVCRMGAGAGGDGVAGATPPANGADEGVDQEECDNHGAASTVAAIDRCVCVCVCVVVFEDSVTLVCCFYDECELLLVAVSVSMLCVPVCCTLVL